MAKYTENDTLEALVEEAAQVAEFFSVSAHDIAAAQSRNTVASMRAVVQADSVEVRAARDAMELQMKAENVTIHMVPKGE